MSAPEQEQQQEVQIVVAAVASVVIKREDTWQIVVTPDGSQYQKNLWTKDQAVVGAMSERIGQRFAFTCGVSHWTHPNGSAVSSLWINGISDPPPVGVTPIGQAAPQPQTSMSFGGGQPQAQPAATAVTPMSATTAAPVSPPVDREAQRELRIHRQTASKCATAMVDALPGDEQTFENLVRIAEGWVRYYEHGPAPSPTADAPIPGPTPAPDDDIPY
jgi:hypothetical protein